MTSVPTVGPPPQRTRVRALGLRVGLMEPGTTNTIVDVPGVAVGHRTVWRDEPDPPAGRGTARTGVTAILPLPLAAQAGARIPAGTSILNGAGEITGRAAIEEWGMLETPIFLTSSMAIGRVYDGAVSSLADAFQAGFAGEPVMPIVAECDDSDLNRPLPVQVDESDVRAALDAARGSEAGPVALGVVGAGTGMRAFELKAGIGSASRVVRPIHRWSDDPEPDAPMFTVGVLVMANFGVLGRLTVDGVRVGEALLADGWPGSAGGRARAGVRDGEGSCVVIVATDAPLFALPLQRLARRAGLGLARTGSVAHHGSGEIFLAFSTGIRVPRGRNNPILTTEHLDEEHLDPFFAAVVEATEEATLDALATADTVVGRDGHLIPGLPIDRTLELLRAAGHEVGRP
ncbi:MAG TPA: P1 family peptidase [Candidatus Limnocylindrales bacterium]